MSPLLKHELSRFIVVGTLAAATHFMVVLVLVRFGWAPLLANVIAFVIAFQVSYFGHRGWTFQSQQTQHRRAWPRFLAVASCGFTLNESLYYLLLRYSLLPYWLALAIVLILVAGLTFLSSRAWAFRQRQAIG